MLLIAPHNVYTRARKRRRRCCGCKAISRLLSKTTWWMLQFLMNGRKERERERDEKSWWWSRKWKIVWKFVYVSVKQLVIVSAWSDLILFFISVYFHILARCAWGGEESVRWLMIPKNLRPQSDWFIVRDFNSLMISLDWWCIELAALQTHNNQQSR